MKLHFYHKKTLIPKLLQWFSSGTKNHVSIEINGVVYEAIGGRWNEGGVVMSSRLDSYHMGKFETISLETIEVEIENTHKVIHFLNNQVGKKYDYSGIFGFVFRFIKPKKDKWYCSELAVEALKIGGWKFNQTRISPSALLDIVKNRI